MRYRNGKQVPHTGYTFHFMCIHTHTRVYIMANTVNARNFRCETSSFIFLVKEKTQIAKRRWSNNDRRAGKRFPSLFTKRGTRTTVERSGSPPLPAAEALFVYNAPFAYYTVTNGCGSNPVAGILRSGRDVHQKGLSTYTQQSRPPPPPPPYIGAVYNGVRAFSRCRRNAY